MSGKKIFQIDPENWPNQTTRERVVSESRRAGAGRPDRAARGRRGIVAAAGHADRLRPRNSHAAAPVSYTHLDVYKRQFQYTSQAYFKLTQSYGITPSMSRKGNPYDLSLIHIS